MLHQYFATEGGGADTRFYEIGRRLVSRGHQVTVITGNSRLNLQLESKRIGLLQKEGMAVVTFNLRYSPGMKTGEKRRALIAYARRASRQGRHLPRPDLVLASTPPLTAVMPALSLCRYYRVPLVAEIRELWPDAVISRGTLRNKTLISLAQRLEYKTYRDAELVIASCGRVAGAVRERSGRSHVPVIPDHLGGDELFEQFADALKRINRAV